MPSSDFFSRQEEARARSRRLVPWFAFGLLGVVAALYVLTTLFLAAGALCLRFGAGVLADMDGTSGGGIQFAVWSPGRLLVLALLVLGLFLAAAFRKLRQLSAGGRVVAEALGARRVAPDASDLDQRRLLNVVAEMAVASGTPMPAVYVLDREPSINAFVAGHSVDDMVVAVTGGALKYLTRDELQGIIAHEYSHLLNGDMALNLRLMGWVHGLFALTLIAEWQMARANRRFQAEGWGAGAVSLSGPGVLRDLALTVMGFALSFIGWHAAFFGRIIKGAVSRQREFLADAAAVQFTRYPQGLADALEKVRQWPEGGTVIAPRAEEASHVFFVNARGEDWFGCTATHPPLEERIRRVRQMMGRQEAGAPASSKPVSAVVGTEGRSAEPVPRALAALAAEEGSPAPRAAALPVAQVFDHAGWPTAQHLQFARELIGGLPAELLAACRAVETAPVVGYALLLSTHAPVRERQLNRLGTRLPRAQFESLSQIQAWIQALPVEGRIPVLELTFPALRCLTKTGYEEFSAVLRELVEADHELDVFEFALLHALRRHVAGAFHSGRPVNGQVHALQGVVGDVSVLLTILATVGQPAPAQQAQAFAAGVRTLASPRLAFRQLPPGQCSLRTLEHALGNLGEAGPSVKRSVLRACAATVAADGLVRLAEAELLRAVADALDCPLPPLVTEPSGA